ncbi:uncharacterized protein LOC115395502 [Salarias fasciatus]|uniref:Uncharacterized LOC115395432 n=1 Tax=Salarias fasciatus TaxID=181472 RepID=A0A672G8V9_SALFA|nr:uncharacterized protein LOC115395502 [Salarias fasciatus]
MVPLYLLVLCQICQVAAVYDMIQDSGVITARVGENVTLQCSSQDNTVTFIYWYQQILMGKPQLISVRMTQKSEVTISAEYQDRFKVVMQNKKGINDLIISDLKVFDSAVYYCGILHFNAVEFGQGVFLHVKSSQSNIQPSIHQPALMPLQLGQNGNLSCIVNSEPCAGGQMFYWLKQGGSQPAVVYPGEGWCSNEGRNCTSHFLVKSAGSSDPGTYYCAVDICGKIVFGNGTKVEIEESPNINCLLVYSLSVVLAVSVVVLLVLVSMMCKLKNKTCSDCKGTVSQHTCSAGSNDPNQDAHDLHYAALSVGRNTERHFPDNPPACVYSGLRITKD